MDIILITQYYKTKTNDKTYDTERQKEIDYCLLQNCMNNYITEIHLLVETIYNLDFIPSEYHDMIKQININKRLTYLDAFSYYNNNLLNKVCILANADIFMDSSLYIIEHINFNFDILFCCTRYEYHEDYPHMLYGTESNQLSTRSQDAWIWKTNNMNRLLNSKYDFMLGVTGCDNMICKLLTDDYYTIICPSKLLLLNHYDNLSTIIDESGIKKGKISSKKNNKVGTLSDYMYLQHTTDIPDKYTTKVSNYMNIEDYSNMCVYNTNGVSTKIEKNVELIPFNNFEINASSMKKNIE